jgi:Na+/alanine symporter
MAAVAASVLDTGAVWTVSEIFNGLMALPNLIALALLTPVNLLLYTLLWTVPGLLITEYTRCT